MSKAEWAVDAAEKLIEKFEDEASIDTANYQLCSFIIAAAKIARDNPEFAALVGSLMEAERGG